MKKLVLVALCCMASLTLGTGVAGAADFCASNATELQTALTTAQSNGEDDVIMVVKGTYAGHFTYSSTEGYSITLQGGYTAGCADRVVDPANTVLDGGNTERVLLVNDSKGGDIQVDGLTIQHGTTTSEGGGINAQTFTATGSAGAITITNSIIQQNRATNAGGGVLAYSYTSSGTAGTVTLTNNTVTGNSAGNYGGGVWAESGSVSGTAGTVTLLNNTITGNTAYQTGGALAWSYSNAGGTAGTVTLLNNTITGNTAYQVGGALAESYSVSGTAGTVTLLNNTITGNSAYTYGGGLYLNVRGHSGGTVNCYNNIVWGNAVTAATDVYLYKSSSGVANGYNNDYATMTGSWNNSGNNINLNPLFIGGGDYRLQSGSPCKDAGNNSAPGLPTTDFEGDPRIIDVTVDIGADEVSILTTCVSDAAGLQAALTPAQGDGKGDVIMVVQGTYTGNFSYYSSQGYGITLLGGYTSGCAGRVVNPANTVLDGDGSGRVLYLYDYNGGDISVEGFTMRNGYATGSGGGVYAYSSSDSGAAGDVTLLNNTVTGSSTAAHGGGLYATSYSIPGPAGTVTLLNNTATGNSAAGSGGGVFAFANSNSGAAGTVTLTNNTVTGNSADYGGGAYLYIYGASGGIVNVYNDICWGNTAATAGADVYLYKASGAAYGYNNDGSDVAGDDWDVGVDNINADPLFADPGYWDDNGTPGDPSDDFWVDGDYHLQPTSPCIDTGLNSAPGIPATDFEGDARIIDGNNDGTTIVDMGADEFNGFLPVNGTIFAACSLINKYQPSFQWTGLIGPFKSYTILFSTSDTDFLTKGILIAKANIKGTKSSYLPSSGVWKKLFTASWNNGTTRNIYWKVMGTRTDKSTVSSAVWNFSIDVPVPPVIQSPPGPDPVSLHAATPPTFIFYTNCNVKFRLEISTLGDFSDPKKIKAYTYTAPNPNVTTTLVKTLSSGQWTAVKKLITGTGYFRIRAWDGIKRETPSETRSFIITP